MRTKETIEAHKPESDSAQNAPPKYGRGQNPRSLANLAAPWQPGQSGNPGGQKRDRAQEAFQAVFENNPHLLYEMGVRAIEKNQAFMVQVMADRAYGKPKETKEITHLYADVPDDQLLAEYERLTAKLGFAREADDAAAVGFATARASKANGKAQDTHVLPGNGTVKA